MRDRAHGLTYMLFATSNLVALALCWVLVDLDKLTLEADALQASLFPYAWFALTLPVIMLEWFEPSGAAAVEIGEEEEE